MVDEDECSWCGDKFDPSDGYDAEWYGETAFCTKACRDEWLHYVNGP